tara:strand:+ start:695 stop:991 length:297 start_codon:yes stop_codon:yes gene_type:complete
MNKKRELSYNGWTNFETWTVSVWDYIPYFVDSAYDQELKPEDIDSGSIEDEFRDLVDSDIPNSGIISDLVNLSLSKIDWREIAEHVREGLEEKIMDNY